MVKTFTVEGEGAFPVDMLRYDECKPATNQDLATMGEGGLRQVTLTTKVRHGVPTEERWKSFDWNVIPKSASRS